MIGITKTALHTFILATLLMTTMSACAVGNKYDYASCSISKSCNGGGPIAVSVHDQRPFIRSGNKSPDFVGLQRGGYGNPFDVRTASHQPLADDMLEVMNNWLSKSGFDVKSVSVTHTDSVDKVKTELLALKTPRSLLLTIAQWKTDTYTNVKLIYEIDIALYSSSCSILAQGHVRGEDNLGGNVINPPSYAQKAAPSAFSSKLDQLLSDPSVVKALVSIDEK